LGPKYLIKRSPKLKEVQKIGEKLNPMPVFPFLFPR